jgi:tetratricopeptide (TPR) repeat protein
LVGREQEVGLLLERWEHVQDGQGQIVLLSGEGGIGKSRLVQVLKEHVASEEHNRLECRSSPYYQNTALYPITGFLQRTLQFQADDAPEQRLEKLERELNQYRLPVGESVPLFAGLLSLPLSEDQYPPLNWTPQRQRQKTLETIVAMFLEQAEQQPVLFILEDLHWTDPTTLELLDLLIDQTPTASIYTLLTCRPEFQSTWSSRSYLTQITLKRLSRHQIERMAQHVADGERLPGEVLQQIIEKTDGVPLFVEEMTKAVLESGTLKEVNGKYEIVGSLASLAIPATLQDSLMARLDRLVTAKAVAQYAAVIGRQFSYELLQTVSQLDETMLQHELKRLVDAELLYQRGLPPQTTYTFKHALIQDTAYESLLRSTRQQYHAQVATVLESQFPDTTESQPELLAQHYTEAGLNEQAVDFWQRAGEKAIQRSAYVESSNHLKKGLEVLHTVTETTERDQRELTLQLALAESLSVVEGYASATLEPIYRRACEVGKQLDETPQLVSTLQLMRRYYMMRLDFATARQLGAELLDLARQRDDPALLQEGHWGLGQTLYFLGDMIGARTHLEQSIASYVPQPLTVQASRDLAGTHIACLITLGRTVWVLGYPDQARRYTCQGLSLAQALAHPFTLAYAYYAAAESSFLRRDIQEILEQSKAALVLSHEHDFQVWVAAGLVIQGWAFAMQGQTDEGLRQICDVLISHQEVIHEANRLTAFVMLADVCGLAGKARDGLQTLDESLALVGKTGGRLWEAELYRLQGVLLLSQDTSQQKTAEAETCFQKAMAIAQNQSAKSWELRAATSLARLQKQQGKQDEARKLLAEVYNWFTEGFDTADLKEAKALLEQLEQ